MDSFRLSRLWFALFTTARVAALRAPRLAVLALALSLLAVASAAHASAAQDRVRVVNPEAIEFETPVLDTPGGITYRMELFLAGADTLRDPPVLVKDISPDAARRDGRVRVDLRDLVLDVEDGRYVATIRVIGSGMSRQSAASEPFVLSRPDTLQQRADNARRERFWTRVGIAIGGGLLLLPLLF